MSVRPPTRSPVPAAPTRLGREQDEDLDDLEELGDDAIISQQTAAHAPKPRVNVAEESRSIVITEHPTRRTEPPRRSSGEATLVIRDRRALDELRSSIERRKNKKAGPPRSVYLWGALGVVAFLLGGVVAFLATDDSPSGVAQPAPQASDVAPQTRLTPSQVKPSAQEPPKAVRLDDLPVEPPRKR